MNQWPEDIMDIAERVHEANIKWWPQQAQTRNKGEAIMLMISELSEALEGERKDRMDDHLPHRKMAEVEMADTVIRILDFAFGFGLVLQRRNYWEEDLSENKGTALLQIVNMLTFVLESPRNEEFTPDPGYWLSRAIEMILEYCRRHDYSLWSAFDEKMAYNAHRPDHKLENRMAEGGKKF